MLGAAAMQTRGQTYERPLGRAVAAFGKQALDYLPVSPHMMKGKPLTSAGSWAVS
jgi:hypothetical protein